MRELSTMDKARLLIRKATGEESGDGYIVTDIAKGYVEPGYGNDDSVVVFGNWNPKRFAREDDASLSKVESLAPRLGDALEKIGVDIEWFDEWATCSECYRALRTEPDSYGWTMFGAVMNDCEIVCADCMCANPESYLSDWVNNPRKTITWLSISELEELGFVKWEANDPHDYENSFHPGQNDDPTAIMREITCKLDNLKDSEIPRDTQVFSSNRQIVFVINSVGQFDMSFSAYVRNNNEGEEE